MPGKFNDLPGQQLRLIEMLNCRLADTFDLPCKEGIEPGRERERNWMQTYLTSPTPLANLTDDDLLQQAHLGDPGAFELLVERYSGLLLLLIGRLVRDESLAHDVLQHVFLQLYRSLPTLRTDGTLKAWLSQVARHRSIDELRRRRPILFCEIEPYPEGSDSTSITLLPDLERQPEEQVELHELRELLLDAIESLPSRYRAVVMLRYTTQLSYREIGQTLRIPETTAKTYFYRARKQLRILLEPEFVHN